MVLALDNARTMLDQGFTSLFSAAGVGYNKLRIEPVLRDVINAGRYPGPRIKAASPEIVSSGGLGDERMFHMHQESVGYIADGPDEVRKACRLCVREGVDNLKINISGDEFCRPGQSERITYFDAEVAAAVEVAREAGVNIITHARADKAVRLALKHGIDIIYHADYATNKTLDMLEAKKKDIYLAPAVGIVYTFAHEAAEWGITREVAESYNMFYKMEHTVRTYQEVRKRGIRAMPGGDYGFAWNPIGANARDLEHFVNLFGYSPAEALIGATKWGGELMGPQRRHGQGGLPRRPAAGRRRPDQGRLDHAGRGQPADDHEGRRLSPCAERDRAGQAPARRGARRRRVGRADPAAGDRRPSPSMAGARLPLQARRCAAREQQARPAR